MTLRSSLRRGVTCGIANPRIPNTRRSFYVQTYRFPIQRKSDALLCNVHRGKLGGCRQSDEFQNDRASVWRRSRDHLGCVQFVRLHPVRIARGVPSARSEDHADEGHGILYRISDRVPDMDKKARCIGGWRTVIPIQRTRGLTDQVNVIIAGLTPIFNTPR